MKPLVRILGLDLTGQGLTALRPALIYGFINALLEVLPCGVLLRALWLVFNGTATVMDVLWLSLVLLAAFVGAWLCKARALLSSFTATYDIVSSMRLAAADRLGRMSLGRIGRERGAAVADLFTDRFTLYQDIVTHMWWQVSSTVAFPVLLWALLVIVDWRSALVVLAFVPITAWIVPWSFRLLDRATDRVIPVRNDFASRVVEIVEGIKDIRLMDVSGARLAAARSSATDLETGSLATELAPSPAILSFAFVWSLAMAAVILFNVIAWGQGRVSLFTMASSLVLTARLCASLADFGVFLIEFRFARRALASIREFVDQPLLPVPADPRMPQDASVDIVDVGFAHAADSTLEAVSLNIPAGSVLALVGPSGSGKTTLAGLIARLWDVDLGSIRIGGVDIRDMSPDILNDTVSMVLQDVSLFGMSARDNIRLGKPDADDEQVMAAARAARIHERIMQLPQGYDTMLESGDGLLSGGERQRIAIARALIRNAPVLILDEASASVDLENEWLIREALRDLMKGRTVIVIAHRLWLASGADRIALMSNGRVTETGSHSELMAAKGHYARLIEAQSSASPAMF